ncbi:hypothetical protein ACPRNU_23945 [Chromobacterium vaccinii]|uniref:hypothetical protein n=1 Tax=Chromobacterium vaccinii TaxID=1108595 RepID=UPI003C76A59F
MSSGAGIRQQSAAMPLFIGFTEVGKPGLYLLSCWEDYKRGLCAEIADPLEQAFFGFRCRLPAAVQHYFDNGGEACLVYSAATYSEVFSHAAPGLLAALCSEDMFYRITRQSGIAALAMPDLSVLDDGSVDAGEEFIGAWQRMLAFCRCLRIPFSVQDVPSHPDAARTCLALAKKTLGAEYCVSRWR